MEILALIFIFAAGLGLFNEDNRASSHEGIRLAEPVKLATYLLRTK